jgi:hypothetical protein
MKKPFRFPSKYLSTRSAWCNCPCSTSAARNSLNFCFELILIEVFELILIEAAFELIQIEAFKLILIEAFEVFYSVQAFRGLLDNSSTVASCNLTYQNSVQIQCCQ